MRKENVDIDILVTSRNGDRKVMQSIRIRVDLPCLGKHIRALISRTLVASSKFFLLLLYELKNGEIQLGYYCYNSFPHKTFRIWRA